MCRRCSAELDSINKLNEPACTKHIKKPKSKEPKEHTSKEKPSQHTITAFTPATILYYTPASVEDLFAIGNIIKIILVRLPAGNGDGQRSLPFLATHKVTASWM